MAKQFTNKMAYYPVKSGYLKWLFTALSGIIILAACSNNPFKKPKCSVNFFYLRYDSTSVAKWMEADKHTAGFVLNFYSTNGENCDTAFGAISYIMDSSRHYQPVPDTLNISRDSARKNFTGKIILGNNWVSRAELNKIFIKQDGSLRPFKYILFAPKLDAFNNRHVVYELRVFDQSGEVPAVFLGSGESKPSPPAPPEF